MPLGYPIGYDENFQQIPMPGYYPPMNMNGEGIEMSETPEFAFQGQGIPIQHFANVPYPAPKQKPRFPTFGSRKSKQPNIPLHVVGTNPAEIPNRNGSDFEITPVKKTKSANRKSNLIMSTVPPNISRELATSQANLRNDLGPTDSHSLIHPDLMDVGSRRSLVTRPSLLTHPSANFASSKKKNGEF